MCLQPLGCSVASAQLCLNVCHEVVGEMTRDLRSPGLHSLLLLEFASVSFDN